MIPRSRLGFVVRQVVHDLRANLLVRPALITALLSALAVFVVAVDLPTPTGSGLRWLFDTEPGSAQAVLGSIAGSMMAVVSIVYSVLIMALSLASMQFSPRILGGFMRDRVSQTTLGIFIGTFVFCLIILRSITSEPRYVPAYGVTIAIALALTALGWLVYFIHHMATSIQANHLVARIARETELAMREDPSLSARVRCAEPPCPVDAVAVTAYEAGYVQLIDDDGLRDTAREFDLVIHVAVLPGDFVAKGVLLARVAPAASGASGPSGPSPQAAARIESARERVVGAFDLGPVRTMQQDVLFGFRQIVDIALKAISTAVNDPSTAATCIDYLGHLLHELALQPEAPTCVQDAHGVVRVVLAQPAFEDALDLAMKQLRQHGRSDMSVAVRLLGALETAALATTKPAHLRRIWMHAHLLDTALAPHFQAEDREGFAARLAHLDACTRAARAAVP